MKSAGNFERFNKDYGFCINREFEKIYATSSQYSWSNGAQFGAFCKAANIPCEQLHPERFFRDGMCDGAFLTREYRIFSTNCPDYPGSSLRPPNWGICRNNDNFRFPHSGYALEKWWLLSRKMATRGCTSHVLIHLTQNIKEDYTMEKYIYNNNTAFGMNCKEIITSLSWCWTRRTLNPSECGAESICDTSRSIVRCCIPHFFSAAS